MSFFLAATAAEKLKDVPVSFWINSGLVIAGFVIAVILLQRVAHMNKLVLALIVFVTLALVGFTWVYNRNEPAFLTPVVDAIAPFFPSKGAYQVAPQADPKKPGGQKTPPAKAPAGGTPQKK